jgi:hypothetical protein
MVCVVSSISKSKFTLAEWLAEPLAKFGLERTQNKMGYMMMVYGHVSWGISLGL